MTIERDKVTLHLLGELVKGAGNPWRDEVFETYDEKNQPLLAFL